MVRFARFRELPPEMRIPMTLVFLQYPPVYILFLIAAALILLNGKLRKYAFISAFTVCLLVIGMILWGLYNMVPLTELLLLLLLLLLACFFTLRKGDKP